MINVTARLHTRLLSLATHVLIANWSQVTCQSGYPPNREILTPELTEFRVDKVLGSDFCISSNFLIVRYPD